MEVLLGRILFFTAVDVGVGVGVGIGVGVGVGVGGAVGI